MTVKEYNKQRRKAQRQELKEIESHLHPEPEPINDCQICHSHIGRYIIFSAWKGDRKANARSLRFHRQDVLADKHFYNNHSSDFKWLVGLLE